jgi:hypothetical protein
MQKVPKYQGRHYGHWNGHQEEEPRWFGLESDAKNGEAGDEAHHAIENTPELLCSGTQDQPSVHA